MSDVAADILEWAGKLKPWQQDALRRLALTDRLTPEDEEDLLGLLKAEHGIPIEPAPPVPQPLTAAHLSAASAGKVVRFKAIDQVKHVNRLADDQRIDFSVNGLTAVYGGNGSGKSGYARILRNACRSRISSIDGKRKAILADAYGGASKPAAASFHLDVAGADVAVRWTDGDQPNEFLMQVSVFDSDAAAVYIDEGNHVAFLPFNLDLLFKLNGVCTQLRAKLDVEMQGLKDVLAAVKAEFDPATEAGRFLSSLSASTSTEAASTATEWTEAHTERLRELIAALSGQDQSEITDLQALAESTDRMMQRIAAAGPILSEDAGRALRELQHEAISARAASDIASESAFKADCLPGVGGDTWRRLYAAARDYSLQVAYPGRAFPVVDDEARCVLCHQHLAPQAAERFRRFDAFVTGELARQASSAEERFRDQREGLTGAVVSLDGDADYLERMRRRDEVIAERVATWITEAKARKAGLLTACEDARWVALAVAPDATIGAVAAEFSSSLKLEAAHREAAHHGAERQRLEMERHELVARQRLSSLRPLIEQRVKDLELHAALSSCADATSTTGITRKAGELSEKHLTPRVRELFEQEVAALRLQHLNPNLARRPDRRGAQYKTDLAPTLKCRSSDILSEGEHRALALASFLAEAKAVSDEDTIIIDDPVSSLDHERSILVAQRLIQEAQRRQVVVFTHSLVFLHHLAAAAERRSVDMECKAIYRSGTRTGLLDPGGEPWEGKSLRKRLGVMEGLLAQVRKKENEPPEHYGLEVRNFYGRLRDCWERLIEEKVFAGVLTRFDQAIKTQNLRYVEVTDDLQRRIEGGMDRSSTYSHDNPASLTAPIPTAAEAAADLQELRDVLSMLDAASKVTEARRRSPVVAALVKPIP